MSDITKRMADALDLASTMITNHESGHHLGFQECERIIIEVLEEY
jgi:hypothetical protein